MEPDESVKADVWAFDSYKAHRKLGVHEVKVDQEFLVDFGGVQKIAIVREIKPAVNGELPIAVAQTKLPAEPERLALSFEDWSEWLGSCQSDSKCPNRNHSDL